MLQEYYCNGSFLSSSFSIRMLPTNAFENLNSLENLNIQNNKLTSIPEDIMEPIIDTLRVVDIMGNYCVGEKSGDSH